MPGGFTGEKCLEGMGVDTCACSEVMKKLISLFLNVFILKLNEHSL